MVAEQCRLSDLSSKFCGQQWGWNGDIPGITGKIEYLKKTGSQCTLDLSNLSVAAG